MFSLQTVAIAYHTPSLRSEERLLKRLITEKDESVLIFEMPEAGRVEFKTLKSIWLNLTHLFIQFYSLMIP